MRIETDHGNSEFFRHLINGLHPLINWLDDAEICKETFLESAGITTESLSNPDTTITPNQEIGFTRDVYETIRRPELGLLVGPRYHLSNYGMLGLAAMTSENLLEALRVISKNILLTWTYFRVSLYDEDDMAYIQMDPIRDLGESLQFMIERDLSAFCQIANEALDQRLPLKTLELQHSETEYGKMYVESFGVPASFGCKTNRIGFEKKWLYKKLPKSDPSTSRIFYTQSKKISETLQSNYSFTEHIRYHLLNSNFETPSLESIARALNTTTRTVQRKLAAENTRFQKLLDDARMNVAIEYLLTTKLTTEEIAEHISYNDAAAFSNAFKRWKGVSPKAYREKHLKTQK